MRRLISLVLMILLLVTATPLMAQDDVEVCSPADVAARVDEVVLAYTEAREGALDNVAALDNLIGLQTALSEIRAQCAGTGELSNPFTFGVPGTSGKGFTLHVTDLIRPANYLFREQPAAGEEYIVVDVVVSCDEQFTGRCEVTHGDFELVGELGVIYDAVSVYSGGFLDVDLFAGGSRGGGIPFLIGKVDTDLTLLYLSNRYEDNFVAYEAEPDAAQ